MNLQAKHIGIAAGAIVVTLVGWRLTHNQQNDQGGDQALDRAVPVIADQVRVSDVPLYVTGVGTVQAYNSVTIQARVDGQLESIDFREGQDVKTGDVLAHIDPRPFQATLDGAIATLAKDQATLANAKRDLARYQDTAAKGYSSRQQADTQSSAVASLTAAVQSDQAAVETAKLQLAYATIVAPIDGRTGIRRVDKGNIVHAADGSGMLVITQLQPISAIFTLPQDLLPRLTGALNGAGLAVTAFARDGKTELGRGSLELIDNQVDPATGTVRLKARFDNPDKALWPGAFINIRLQLGAVHDGLTVDSRVVQRGPKGVYAYVIKSDNTVEMRPITVTQDYGGQSLISNGLAADERVVVDGQLRLRQGAKVATTSAQPRTGRVGAASDADAGAAQPAR